MELVPVQRSALAHVPFQARSRDVLADEVQPAVVEPGAEHLRDPDGGYAAQGLGLDQEPQDLRIRGIPLRAREPDDDLIPARVAGEERLPPSPLSALPSVPTTRYSPMEGVCHVGSPCVGP
nr:hypothetical protein GCM10020093_070030 [Planobispora longispora]